MKSKIYIRLTMVFATILMFTYIATAQTTINVKIVDGGDDAEEYQQEKSTEEPAGYMDITSSDTELCNESEGVQQMVGFIFRDVQIPVGSTITNAYIQYTADDLNDEAITLDIWGAKLSTVTAPWGVNQGDNPFAISSQPKTTALVQWTPVAWAVEEERGPDQQTPDISSIVQEIIGVDGWAPGNNLAIILMDMSGTVKQHREAEAWEDNDGAGASELFVTFTEGGGTGVNSVSAEFSSLIYPNPSEGKLNIENPSTDKFSYQIYTINGKLVSSRLNIAGSTTEVDLSSLAKGMYFVNVRTTEKTETHKLILK